METGETARASILWGLSFFHLLLVYAEYISPLLGLTRGEQQVVWLVTEPYFLRRIYAERFAVPMKPLIFESRFSASL